MKLQFSLKDFVFGLLAGLFFSLLAWSYTAYCHIHLSLVQKAVGISVITLSFGITAGFFGIDKLMDNIP